MKILYLEDDIVYIDLVSSILTELGYHVQAVRNGCEAIRHLENQVVDLLILDWQVPGLSGLEVLAWTRERIGVHLPIMFLSGQVRDSEILAAINAGADDYILKPVNHCELIARVNALLRRAYPKRDDQNSAIEIGGYRIDLKYRTAWLNGQPVKLTPREFEIAALLFRNVDRVMPRDALIRAIWGRDLGAVSRSLDTHIYRIRAKLAIRADNGVRLRTIYTHGYRLEAV
jgi:two-component system, OmpR family, phosphate regulon response regulator PhoB